MSKLPISTPFAAQDVVTHLTEKDIPPWPAADQVTPLTPTNPIITRETLDSVPATASADYIAAIGAHEIVSTHRSDNRALVRGVCSIWGA